MKSKLCPCHSLIAYSLCCGPLHKSNLHASTAVALMRSRYSAYVLNNAQYIYRTWDSDTRPTLQSLREKSIQAFTYLEIIDSTKGNATDESGTVEFIASYRLLDNADTKRDSEIYHHHENSYFLKDKKQWKYVNELSKIQLDEN